MITYRKDHEIFYEGDALAWIRSEAGEPELIDVTFRGGEHIRLALEWELELIAVPGHSEGHLAVYDSAHQALYAGDAIQGRGYRGLDGAMKLCPTYEAVNPYLGTIALIERLPITTFVGCHWPIKRGAEIAEFCRESREFVDYTDRVLLEHLSSYRTLREICIDLGPVLGEWPRSNDLELVYALNGHVKRLQERKMVTARRRTGDHSVLEFICA